jgi:hypothetical protein
MKAAPNLIVSLLLASALGGCTTPVPSGMPADFGVYDGRDARQAVSFDRVVYQVKRVENKPFADLAFWQIALKERLTKAGYVVTADGPLEAAGKPGYYIETTAPRGASDYMYLVALFVQGKDLIVIESAGEVAAYKAQREKIFAAIRADDLKRSGAPGSP